MLSIEDKLLSIGFKRKKNHFFLINKGCFESKLVVFVLDGFISIHTEVNYKDDFLLNRIAERYYVDSAEQLEFLLYNSMRLEIFFPKEHNSAIKRG